MEAAPQRLLAAIDDVANEDVAAAADAVLLDRVRLLERARRKPDAAMVAAVGIVHQRGAAGHDGAISTKSWLHGRLNVTDGEAGKLLNAARYLADEPAFAEAFAAGTVTLGHVQVAARLAKDVGPDHAAEAVGALLGPAQTMDATALRQVANRIRELVRPEKDDPPPDPDADRSLFLSQTFNGFWDIAGRLTPEAGALAHAFFTAAAGKRDPDDNRSPCERRHDSARDLFHLGLSTADLPAAGGEQPHISVVIHARDLQKTPGGKLRLKTPLLHVDGEEALIALHAYLDDNTEPIAPDWATLPDWTAIPDHYPEATVDWDALLHTWADESAPSSTSGCDIDLPPDAALPLWANSGSEPSDAEASSLAELANSVLVSGARPSRMPGPGAGGITDSGSILHPEAVRRLACDAGINRIVLDPHDVPINAGRRQRLPSNAIRRVLVARDGGCRFHGCDRPPAWTQAHHVVHWADGGTTDLNNLLMLCGFHHHRVHDDGWTLTFDGRTVTIHRPDGTLLDPP